MATIGPSVADAERMKRFLDAMQPQIAQAVATYQKMEPQLLQAAAAYQKMKPQIQDAVATYAAVALEIKKTAHLFEKDLAEVAQKAVLWYDQYLRQIGPVLEGLGREYARLQHSADRGAVPILKKRRWFGLERYLDPWEFHGLIAAYDRAGAKAADKYVCGCFSRKRFGRLRRVTNDWWRLSYMRKRKSKVRLALKAYRAGHYALVIPILLTFADGLAHAYFRANPAKLPATKSGKKPSVLVSQAAAYYAPVRPDYAGLLTAAIGERLYKSYDFGADRAPSALNRHGILHGDILGYDTEANALRTILLLDAICRVALAGPTVP